MVVENAFGRLKGRWRCLQKRLDFKLSNVPKVVASCVILHNICELYGDMCLDEWLESDHSNNVSQSHYHTTITSSSASNAAQIRDAITHHLA